VLSSRTAIARATPVTLIVWVSRLCTTPLVAIDVTTCVTSASRESAFANRIRSRSVRYSDSPGGYGRSGSGRDLASRGSMFRTLPNAPVVHSPVVQVIEVSEAGSVV
jgi:hypothetical protein